MLSKKEYLYVTLMEECGEIAQRASKVLRFGVDSKLKGEDNLTLLSKEIVDLLILLERLENLGVQLPFSPSKLMDVVREQTDGGVIGRYILEKQNRLDKALVLGAWKGCVEE